MIQLVSVVIPTYNRAHDLAKALDSVLKQTYPHWEALVIDNRSTDSTHEVVHGLGDKRIKYFEVSNNGVIGLSRNMGIAQSNGEFVAFLDSDDGWKADKLEKSIFWLNQGYDLVYHDMRIVSSKAAFMRPRTFGTRQMTPRVYDDLLVNLNTFPASSVVVRKDILSKVGGFSEAPEMIAGEDYDLWLRISALTQRFRQIDGTLGYLSKGNDNQFAARRVISFVSEIESKYVSRLPGAQRNAAYANWIDYALGRSHYRQRNYNAAQDHLIKVLKASVSLSHRIKAIYMLGAIAARKVFAFSM